MGLVDVLEVRITDKGGTNDLCIPYDEIIRGKPKVSGKSYDIFKAQQDVQGSVVELVLPQVDIAKLPRIDLSVWGLGKNEGSSPSNEMQKGKIVTPNPKGTSSEQWEKQAAQFEDNFSKIQSQG